MYDAGKQKEATQRMIFLKNYFETRALDEIEKAKTYPVILLNLSNWEGLAGNFKEALAYTEQGLDISIKYGKLFLFPRFLFNKGYCLSKMNQKDEGEKFFARAFSYWNDMKRHDHAVEKGSDNTKDGYLGGINRLCCNSNNIHGLYAKRNGYSK